RAAQDASHEYALAYNVADGKFVVIRGGAGHVGLPQGYEDYRIVVPTQQELGASPADRASARAAGHPVEVVIARQTLENGQHRTRPYFFDANGDLLGPDGQRMMAHEKAIAAADFPTHAPPADASAQRHDAPNRGEAEKNLTDL